MKSIYRILSTIALLLLGFNAQAKDFPIAINSDPEDAEVYLNGQLVATSTPAIVMVDKKVASKTMIFQVRKEGYESKSATVAYTAQQLKANPVVYIKIKKIASTDNQYTTNDRTVTRQEAAQR
ncbi:MAG: PEGA domain-containing protein, partial [Muribaculaceae bacterium]|nr:PEGA domain-containing protein [Muribaculaceae bacterium]